MRRTFPVLTVILVMAGLALMSSALVLAATDSVEPTYIARQEMPGADGAALLDYILNVNPYTEWGTWEADRWSDYTGNLPSSEPHGQSVRLFVNDVALDAANSDMFDGTLPPGSIVVKENHPGPVDEPGDTAALTVMYKVEGFNPEANDWFWLKAPPDGSSVDAEGAVEGCINCHAQGEQYDYMMRYGFGSEPVTVYGEPLPEANGAAVADYILNVNPYTEWGSWPMQGDQDFTSFLPSSDPHGASVRIFVNERGLDAIEREMPDGYPNGTMVVKENYGGPPDNPGDLAAITLMYKVDDFNPDANDWFWVKMSADGSSIDAEGAVEGCINCHGDLAADQDYVIRFDYQQYHEEMMGEMGGDGGDMGGEMMIDADAVIDQKCTVCHTRDRIDMATKDAAGWEATIDRMIGYGADISDDEKAALIEFLTQ